MGTPTAGRMETTVSYCPHQQLPELLSHPTGMYHKYYNISRSFLSTVALKMIWVHRLKFVLFSVTYWKECNVKAMMLKLSSSFLFFLNSQIYQLPASVIWVEVNALIVHKLLYKRNMIGEMVIQLSILNRCSCTNFLPWILFISLPHSQCIVTKNLKMSTQIKLV